jgi:hypothetical protein
MHTKTKSKTTIIRALAALLCALCVSVVSLPAAVSPTGSGEWADVWVIEPQITDSVTITTGQQITLSNGDSVILGDASTRPTLQISGGSLEITNGTFTGNVLLYANGAPNSVLTIGGGSSGQTATVNIGTSTAAGQLRVGGTGSALNIHNGADISTSYVYIGNGQGGNGSFNMDGGYLLAAASIYFGNTKDGIITADISGGRIDGKSVMNLGYNQSIATVNITNSANVNVSSAVTVGYNGTGTLNVDGGQFNPASTVNVGYLSGSSSLNIANATVNATASTIGNNTTGTVNVNSNGTFNVAGDFLIGSGNTTLTSGTGAGVNGSATVNVNAGTLNAGTDTSATKYVRIGYRNGTGILNINNDGHFTANVINVGESASGTLNVNSGGTLQAVNVFVSNGTNNAFGALNIRGCVTVSEANSGIVVGNGSGASATANIYAGANINSAIRVGTYGANATLNVFDGTIASGRNFMAGGYGSNSNGTINIYNGSVTVTTMQAAYGSNTANGTFNISGGTVKTTSMNFSTAGGYSELNLSGDADFTVTGNAKSATDHSIKLGYYGSSSSSNIAEVHLNLSGNSNFTAYNLSIGNSSVSNQMVYLDVSDNARLTINGTNTYTLCIGGDQNNLSIAASNPGEGHAVFRGNSVTTLATSSIAMNYSQLGTSSITIRDHAQIEALRFIMRANATLTFDVRDEDFSGKITTTAAASQGLFYQIVNGTPLIVLDLSNFAASTSGEFDKVLFDSDAFEAHAAANLISMLRIFDGTNTYLTTDSFDLSAKGISDLDFAWDATAKDLVLSFKYTAVPEPAATAALLGILTLGLLLRRRTLR